MFNSSLSGTTPMDWVESKIQNRVAKFLSMKEKLYRMHTSTDESVRLESRVLMDTQRALEVNLAESLEKIDKAKLGTYNMSDVLSVGLFANSMEKHINKVQALEAQQGTITAVKTSSNTQKIVIGLIGLWVVSKIYRVGRFIL